MTIAQSTAETAHGETATAGQRGLAVVEARQAPAPVTAIDPVIERLIADSSIDLERVKTVLALRREMEEDTARRAFNVAMASCKAEIPQVGKNAKNSENNSRYATLDKIGEAIDRIIAKHGFSTSFHPAPCARDGFLKVVCHVAHISGHERVFEAELPTDAAGIKGSINKTPIHAWKSTMTYGRRVLTEMIFDVKSTNDDDGNAAGAKIIPGLAQEHIDQLRELIAGTKTEEAKVLEGTDCERIEDLSLIQFGEIRLLLEQKLARMAKAVAAKSAA